MYYMSGSVKSKSTKGLLLNKQRIFYFNYIIMCRIITTKSYSRILICIQVWRQHFRCLRDARDH